MRTFQSMNWQKKPGRLRGKSRLELAGASEESTFSRDVPDHLQRAERGRDFAIAEITAARTAGRVSSFTGGFGSAGSKTIWCHRARRKKVIPLSRERLPDLFREDEGRNHGPSRSAQEHAARFLFPQQIAGLGRQATWRDTRVLEVDRAGRENAEDVRVGQLL